MAMNVVVDGVYVSVVLLQILDTHSLIPKSMTIEINVSHISHHTLWQMKSHNTFVTLIW